MADIQVPKLNNNDDSYHLVEWLAADGALVSADEPLVSLETSKALEELVAAEAGVLRQAVPGGARCAPGSVIGRIAAPGTAEASPPAPVPALSSGPAITAPARELMAALGITTDAVQSLDLTVVRRADIEALAAARTGPPPAVPAERCLLSPAQRAVARTVTRSHQTIPAAYTAIQVDLTTAQAVAKRLTREHRALIGPPEFLVGAVSRLLGSFPLFFASPAGDSELELAADAHVGVTVDVGNGLYVPVVTAAGQRTVPQLAQVMAGFRRAAAEGGFRERDMEGGNITVTLHTDLDVVLAIPVIFPGQTCALALAGPRRTLVPDGKSAVATRVVANLGIAYDHRFINGRDAMEFLRAVKSLLEAPEQL